MVSDGGKVALLAVASFDEGEYKGLYGKVMLVYDSSSNVILGYPPRKRLEGEKRGRPKYKEA